MRLVHYSTQPGLKTIDPSFMGQSGIHGEESRKGTPGVPRAYYYREGTEPEKLVTSRAHHRYTAVLDDTKDIYDIGEDEYHHVANTIKSNQGAFDTDQVLGAIKDKGYHGFWNSTSPLPNAVALFHPQDVEFDKTDRTESIIKEIVDKLLG